MKAVNGDPLFPQVNGDLTCACTERVVDGARAVNGRTFPQS